MIKYIFLLVLVIVSLETAFADSKKYKNLSNSDIKSLVHEASKIDGAPGITEQEIVKIFGNSDSVTKNSQWKNSHI